MPIPPGARQVPGNKNRIQLANGDVVTRAHARTLGARFEGFRNENDRRHSTAQREANDKYFQSWSRSNQGQRIIREAQQRARAEGRRYRPDQLRQELLAARNQRYGSSWQSFARDYGLSGERDFTRY
jgi:hypothetical protein